VAGSRPVTLITGASVGIGAALARIFASHGHELVLIARRVVEMEALANEIAAGGRPRPLVLPLDLTDPTAVDKINQFLMAAGVEPQHIVNNAGFGLVGCADSLDRAQQLAMIDLNIRALTDLSLAWTESLARHRGGILNIASIASFLPGPCMAVYYASKAYVLSFSEALHAELKSRGIRVTTLCPGPVQTEFQKRAGVVDEEYPPILTISAEDMAAAGYHGLMRGKRLVVPGLPAKIITLLVRMTPRAWVLAGVATRQLRRYKNQKT
jgi:short-subunit dehydrogenase